MHFNGDSDQKKCEMVQSNYHLRLDGVLVALAQKDRQIRLVNLLKAVLSNITYHPIKENKMDDEYKSIRWIKIIAFD